ncbi:hypothetical protein LTR86_002975 [Recurvomyces mirabilis]|nr:hypothetical protein LTR86_002975 [Recurvomyces mirabilis]
MSRQIESSLSSLLPTVSPLPAQLLGLATSLVAQSRSKASSLKQEEEIGRTYACCHIACERLGKKLALEIGRPVPPCAPKVYNKLKTYLGTVLRTPANTPRAARVVDKLEVKAGQDSSAKKTEEARTPGSGREGLRRTPIKRTLQLNDTPSERVKRTPSTCAVAPEPEREPPKDVPVPLQPDEEEEEEDDNVLTPVKRPSKTPLRRKEKHASRPDGPEDVGAAGLLPGLGTMFQPAVDWLSDERRAEYKKWEKNVFDQIRELEYEVS